MKAEIILTDNNINIDLNELTIDVSTEDGFSVTIIGGVGPQGNRGPEGPKGEKGDDYVLTDEDKDDIAGLAAEKLDLTDYVKNTDYPQVNRMVAGVVKVDTAGGLYVDAGGLLSTYPATGSEIKEGTHNSRPIMPKRQHISVFYGLAKAAGADEKDSEATFGVYTEAAKLAIRAMIGAVSSEDIPDAPVQDVQIDGASILQEGVAIVPIANDSRPGVVKVPVDRGLAMTTAGNISLVPAPSSLIKAGEQNYYPIVPKKQHEAVFYGLAKAAGVDEKGSTLPGGQYTAEAQTAIKAMLGIEEGLRVVRLI